MIAGVAYFPASKCISELLSGIPSDVTISKTTDAGELLTSFAVVFHIILGILFLFGRSFFPKLFADYEENTLAKV
jgi:hypothetical protein